MPGQVLDDIRTVQENVRVFARHQRDSLRDFDVNVVLYHAGAAARRRDDSYERLGEVAKRLVSMPS